MEEISKRYKDKLPVNLTHIAVNNLEELELEVIVCAQEREQKYGGNDIREKF